MSEATRGQKALNALRNSAGKEYLAEFLREELQKRKDSLVNCTKDTFEVNKGRCLELDALLQTVIK